ncbi:hypothetical protein EAE96_003342 [Botrytis aclada]|nr:hypothetical protein EAE96_003342 [Botrytis aclada]
MISDWPSDLTSTIDLVHSRLALPGAGTQFPRSVVTRLVALVEPGRYVQQPEMVCTPWPCNGPPMKEFQQGCTDVFTVVIGGQELEHLCNFERWYREMGLEDVQCSVESIRFPLGQKRRVRGLGVSVLRVLSYLVGDWVSIILRRASLFVDSRGESGR